MVARNGVPAFVGHVPLSTDIHYHLRGRKIMLKSKSIIAAAIAAAFALPLAAYAAGTDAPSGTKSPAKSGMSSGNGGSMSTMKQLDTNNDSYVSKDEAKKSSAISKRFSQLDKDSDGKLSATELSAAEATGAGGTSSSPRTAPGNTSSGNPAGGAPKKSY
jgi:hypothetical protein